MEEVFYEPRNNKPAAADAADSMGRKRTVSLLWGTISMLGSFWFPQQEYR